MRHVIAGSFLLLSAAGAQAECAAHFKATAPDNGIPQMSIFNFGEHWEMQFETPGAEIPEHLAITLDDVSQPVYFSIGLDDMLFVVSSAQDSLQLAPDFLDSVARATTLRLTGVLNGKPISTAFNLKGSAAAVKRLRNC